MGMELEDVRGLEMLARERRCATCGGSGKVHYPDNQGNEWEDFCPVCEGWGWLPQEGVALDGPASFISESNSD